MTSDLVQDGQVGDCIQVTVYGLGMLYSYTRSVYKCIHVTTSEEREAMNLRVSKGVGCMGGVGGGRREVM